MKSLYELTAEMGSLMHLAQTGEIDEQTLADTLDAGLAEEAEQKLEGYAMVIKNLEQEAEMKRAQGRLFAEESKSYMDKATAIDNNVARMKERICAYIASTGKREAKAGHFRWAIRDFKSVVVDGDVPMDYARIKIEPDKAKIKIAIESGIEVKGARLEVKSKAVLGL